MLLWAMFSIGYIFGVFFTLRVFLKDGEFENSVNEKIDASDLQGLSSWDVHRNLIKVNSGKKVAGEVIPSAKEVVSISNV